MKTSLYRFAVLGGDMRQVYLAKLLARKGFRVSVYALQANVEHPEIREAYSLKETLLKADAIAAPLPLVKAGRIFSKEEAEDLTEENILKYVPDGSLFFAGMIPEKFREKAAKKKIQCIDYMKDEAIAVQNTVAVAEGILAEAVAGSQRNLYKSNCLVLGYGRCGSTLAGYLKRMFCHVTVYEKEPAAAARASIETDRLADAANLPRCLMEADFIFNTIPSVILSKAMLEYVKKDALLLDIASAPGGVDYKAAKETGVEAVFLPGLPGRYAPLSSAEILAEAIIKRMDCWKGESYEAER